jgi:hypothetical protein
MYTQKQKETVSLIRSIMRLHGRFPVFNNIYPTGNRTVKCYRETNENDLKLQDTILETLGKLNIKAKIKLTKPSKGSLWAPDLGGFIVKLQG